ncbi:MAG TPA: four helix bundle protein [Chlorobiota bacterium]|nr:four helix bundle protein [Chlorobiota bacterium]
MAITNTHVFELIKQTEMEIFSKINSWNDPNSWDIKSQIQRSTLSISNNIIEGAARGTVASLLHFIMIADGSIQETKNALRVALSLSLLNPDEESELRSKLSKISIGLIKLAHKQLEFHPTYNGKYREIILRRIESMNKSFNKTNHHNQPRVEKTDEHNHENNDQPPED